MTNLKTLLDGFAQLHLLVQVTLVLAVLVLLALILVSPDSGTGAGLILNIVILLLQGLNKKSNGSDVSFANLVKDAGKKEKAQ